MVRRSIVWRSVMWWTVVRWSIVRRTVVRRTFLRWVRVVRVVVLKDVKSVVGEALNPRLGIECSVAQAASNVVRKGKGLVKSVLGLLLGLAGCVSDLVVRLVDKVEDLILGPQASFFDLRSAVVGLNRNVVQDLLVWNDKGTGQCRQRQN